MVFLAFALQLSLYNSDGSVGPGFFPIIISFLFALFVSAYIIKVFSKIKVTNVKKEGFKQKIFYIVSVSVSILLIKYLGFLFTLGMFSVVLLVFFQNMSKLRAIIFSLIMMIAIYAIFSIGLNLHIPAGFFD